MSLNALKLQISCQILTLWFGLLSTDNASGRAVECRGSALHVADFAAWEAVSLLSLTASWLCNPSEVIWPPLPVLQKGPWSDLRHQSLGILRKYCNSSPLRKSTLKTHFAPCLCTPNHSIKQNKVFTVCKVYRAHINGQLKPVSHRNRITIHSSVQKWKKVKHLPKRHLFSVDALSTRYFILLKFL